MMRCLIYFICFWKLIQSIIAQLRNSRNYNKNKKIKKYIKVLNYYKNTKKNILKIIIFPYDKKAYLLFYINLYLKYCCESELDLNSLSFRCNFIIFSSIDEFFLSAFMGTFCFYSDKKELRWFRIKMLVLLWY